MSWDLFILFAVAAILFWLGGAAVSLFTGKKALASVLISVGSLSLFSFILGLWLPNGVPPMRTMGETRLWYSFFISIVGLFIYIRSSYRWILPLSSLLATVFICVNIFKPEIHSQTLAPALQSPWFVPHVISYMFAYSLMGVATVYAIRLWWREAHEFEISQTELSQCDNLVRVGWGFLTLGICMGALWAQEAWSNYWAWDPKETWAAATWISYLLYLHLRPTLKDRTYAYSLLVFSFILLQICWWGINYLPSAQGISVHTY